MSPTNDPIRARVDLERRLRYASEREAAIAGGISNTTWSRYMRDGIITPDVRRGIAQAFNWGTDWPENLPPSPLTEHRDELTAIVEHLQRVENLVLQLMTMVLDQGENGSSAPPRSRPGASGRRARSKRPPQR